MTPLPRSASCCGQLYNLYHPYSELEARIKKIAEASHTYRLTTEDLKDLKTAFKVAHRWVWPAGQIKEVLKGLSAPVLQEFFEGLVNENKGGEASKVLSSYLALCEETQLYRLADWKTSECASRAFVSCCYKRKEFFHNHLLEEGKEIWKTFSHEAKQFLHQIINMLITILGLNSIRNDKPNRFEGMDPPNAYEAGSKWDTYKAILTYPSAIFAFFYAYIHLSIPTLALTTVTVVASIALLVAYNRYYKPCPDSCYGLERVEKAKEPLYMRSAQLKEIQIAFSEGKKVLLVGKAGVGKTALINSLAQLIEQKKGFEGVERVFQCSATALKIKGYESISLPFVQERFKNHENKIILFIDELHTLFKDDPSGEDLHEGLKTFSLPKVIGATTWEEYKTHILPKDQSGAFARRYKVIEVPDLIPEEVKIALIQHLNFKAPQVIADSDVLSYITEKAPNFDRTTPSLINASMALLNSALEKITTFTTESLDKELTALKIERTHLVRKLDFSENSASLIEQLSTLDKRIKNKKGELLARTDKITKVKELESQYLQLQNACYRMAVSKTNLVKGSPLEREWLLKHAQLAALKAIITQKRNELGMPLGLTKDLINTLMPQETFTSHNSAAALI